MATSSSRAAKGRAWGAVAQEQREVWVGDGCRPHGINIRRLLMGNDPNRRPQPD